ncbi:uncharacterized protein LOC141678914 [Apium graveolens]|uniref:uncharacterized protein LOC141678914 n=1 Tax=Apium graveolens TaxID=4045 RepID=UPI003D79B301
MDGENQNNNENQGNNDEGGNVFDQLAETLAVLVNQQPKPNIVSQFKRLNPPAFDGATDPAIVEMWIQEMEKAFGLLGSNEEQKVTLAVYQLQGSAYDWWLMEKRKNETTNLEENHEPYTWAKFKKALEDKYFPRTVRLQKERDFIRLQQGGRTVIEYEAEFAKLAKYASTLVADESSRARRLEEGLRSDIRNSVASFELQTYEAVLNKALVIERGLAESEKASGSWNKRRFTQTSGQSFQGGPLKKPHVYDNIGGQGDQETCTRCGKNHPDKVCRWNTGACFHCGEVGHKISNCPHNPPPPPRKETDNKMGKGRVFQLTGNDNYRN